MISGLLRTHAGRRPGAVLLHCAQRVLRYGGCLEQVTQWVADGRWRGARLGLAGAPADWLLPRLLALDALGARACLLPPDAGRPALDALGAALGLDGVLEPGREPCFPPAPRPQSREGEVVLFSSGTTAAPKPVRHTWASLARSVRVRPGLAAARWLLGHGTSSFAGLQVFLHALANGGTVVVGEAGPAEAARLARERRVTHAAGTPSFFRCLLSLADPADLAALELAQITLGGEAADQGLLDALKRRYPRARLTQVYASTELGVCFSVQDGRAGFPAAFLEAPHEPRLRIVDGELHVGRTPAPAPRGDAGGHPPETAFFPTADLVERRGDRVLFLGRRGQVINVGGRKAHPTEIEAALLEVEGVRAVRVSGLPSSLVGQLVRAEIVLEPALEPEQARRALLAHCRERLRPHMVPRLLQFVSSLDHTPSRKLARR